MRKRLKMLPATAGFLRIFLVFTLFVLFLCSCASKKPTPSTESLEKNTIETQESKVPTEAGETKQTNPTADITQPPETTKPTEATTATEPSAEPTTAPTTAPTTTPTTKPTDPPETAPTTQPTQPPTTPTNPVTEPTESPADPDEEDPDFIKIEYCPDCGMRLKSAEFPYGCTKFSSDTVCECGEFVRAGKCHNHDTWDGGYTGGGGTPETEDYGFCPGCGLRYWTTWYPSGCFSFLEDTVCECGVLVHAMECHHH